MQNRGAIIRVFFILVGSVVLFAFAPNFWCMVLSIALFLYFFWCLNSGGFFIDFSEVKTVKLFVFILIILVFAYLRGWQYAGMLKNPYVETNELILKLQNSLLEHISILFGGQEAGLVAGILLGFKSGISKDLMNVMNTDGLTHVVAVSGFNVTIIVNVLFYFFKSFGRFKKFILCSLCVLFFAVLTGLSGSVLRASFMGLITLVAVVFQRQNSAVNVLLLAGLILVLINPLIIFDIGFQLSFFATLGLLTVNKFFDEMIGEGIFVSLKEGFFITLSAQVFTLPLLLFYFERLSLIAPLANMLILPLIPLIMLFSSVALALSYLSFNLAFIPQIAATFLLKIFLGMANFFSILPFAAVKITAPSLTVCVIYFIAVIAFLNFVDENRS